jgi:tRNA/rRNA methyltransferase/tRNA (cytidine32/uridine32-2'-O)-methyltransferase
MNLDAIRIVLVGTTHPGNIGASARAMKTMGLTQLALVNPHNYPNAEATARASGADDVLYRAKVFTDLDSALANCHLVIGASARRRGISCIEIDPRVCARYLLETALQQGQAALLLGREHSGLTNEELDRCHFMVRIPANPDYSSLNLAAAVQILSYELRLAALSTAEITGEATLLPATADEMERFYTHLQNVLLESGFLDPNNPRHLMRRLRRLFNRALPDQHEINILRGILSAIQNTRRN